MRSAIEATHAAARVPVPVIVTIPGLNNVQKPFIYCRQSSLAFNIRAFLASTGLSLPSDDSEIASLQGQLTYAVVPHSNEEKSTDLEEGATPDCIELHTVPDHKDYIYPNMVLQLQVATKPMASEKAELKVICPCLKRTSTLQDQSAQSVAVKIKRSVTFQEEPEIREFEKYLVPDIDELSSDSDFEYEETTTLSKP